MPRTILFEFVNTYKSTKKIIHGKIANQKYTVKIAFKSLTNQPKPTSFYNNNNNNYNKNNDFI